MTNQAQITKVEAKGDSIRAGLAVSDLGIRAFDIHLTFVIWGFGIRPTPFSGDHPMHSGLFFQAGI